MQPILSSSFYSISKATHNRAISTANNPTITCRPPWAEVGKGRIVAESTSPVGKGTAGLLLINGIPPPLSGTMEEELPLGAGLGESACRGWNGHENAGEDDTTLPEEGAGAGDGPRLVEL